MDNAVMTELIEGVVLSPDKRALQQEADYIAQAWQQAVVSIVETGRRTREVRERAEHGEWQQIVDLLPFNRQTANKLMIIAEHPDISNVSHGRHLPASWTTLYALTPLPAGEIPKRIDAGEITPELDRATAQQWASSYQAAKQEALNAWNQAGDALTAALSYVKTYRPPADTDIYLSVDDFIERADELALIARSWKDDVDPE